MVERTVCSSEEETNTTRSVSCTVVPLARRNDDFGSPKIVERLENNRKFDESEVLKVIESTRHETTRDSGISGFATITGRFSLFKWFKRGSRDTTTSWDHRLGDKSPRKYHQDCSDLEDNELTSELSSNESVETLYGTATVRSFDFQSGNPAGDTDAYGSHARRHFDNTTRSVGPFGIGASKIVTKPDPLSHDVTKTLPANVSSKRRDITARYSLQSCNDSSAGFGSCGNFSDQRDCPIERSRQLGERRAVARRVHVRGKRRAPKPPLDATRTKNNEDETIKIPRNKVRSKRRQAPKPPSSNCSVSGVTANFTTRREAESASFSAKEGFARVSLSAKEEIESAELTAREEAGSADSRAKRRAVSAILSTKEETVRLSQLVKDQTGCTNLVAREEAENADLKVKRKAESAALRVKEEILRVNPAAKEAFGSASGSREEAGSADLRAKGRAVSAIFESADSAVKKEAKSDDSRAKGKAISEIITAKGKTESANSTTKRVTECSILSVKKETVSAELSAVGKIDSAEKSEKFPSAKGMNVAETNIVGKVSKKFVKQNERISTFEISDSKQSFGKKTSTNFNDLNKSEIPGTLANAQNFTASNTTDHENVIVEQGNIGNSSFSRTLKKNDDSTSLTFVNDAAIFHGAVTSDQDVAGIISNDSLVLQGGVLHSRRDKNTPTSTGPSSATTDAETTVTRSKGRISVTTGSQTSASAMPRPWYKRSVFEHSRDSGTSARRGDILRNTRQTDTRDEDIVEPKISATSSTKYRQIDKNQDGGTLSRLNFFHKSEKFIDERKMENKRKSGITMLANISELDKEAAAIVQEEQARTRAASMFLQASRSRDETMINDDTERDVVQEMVTSAMENSPRRGTRALISKFNAIGNMTRVTVNTSFFAKNSYSRDEKFERSVVAKKSAKNDSSACGNFSKTENTRSDKDLSKYFLPARRTVADKKIDEFGEPSSRINPIISANFATEEPDIRQDSTNVKKIDSMIRENSFEKIEKNLDFDGRKKISRSSVDAVKLLECELPETTRKINVEDDVAGKNDKMIDRKNGRAQREFSNIFREIAERSSTRESSGKNSNEMEKKSEASGSIRVSRVLDILVEASKNDRKKANCSSTNVVDEFNGNSNEKNDKTRISSTRDIIENPLKTDLREMLKEMKHSLPKRPKPKKSFDHENNLNCETRESIAKNDRRKEEFFFSKNEKSPLLSPLTMACPPSIRIGGDNDVTKQFRVNVERDNERPRVSSAAQTSGNLRKITGQNERSNDKSSKWRNEDVIYRTSGNAVAATVSTSGLTKNTFQLMRPREFARIEAVKTMKNSTVENTYANVIERSLYANTTVPVTNENRPRASVNVGTRRDFFEEKKLRDHNGETMEIAPEPKVAEPQNMNTLAVNRLLRKLEAAIASGHHQQAAGLAKELARLKIHCSVVRQRTKAKDVVNVDMYIEDKLAHQGPIPLRLTRSMTVAQLKAKVFAEFEIPTNVQRWIVGKNLADDDSTKLEELQAVEGSPVFLYLVAPESKVDETPLREENLPVTVKEPPNDPEPEPIDEITKLVELDEPEKLPVESQTIKEEEEEEEEEEDEDEEECISEEVRMERYEALISLENCDVIPNSEPIECPICFVTYGPQEGVILRDCLHMFCRPCIANTIRYCDEAEVGCPFRDTEYTCESTLQEREIKALVEPEVYQQHLAKSIAQAENNAGNNAFHCKTPDCPGWCIYDDNVNNFLCPVCGVNNCLTCQVVHTGKNCRQYQEELRLSKETDQESKRTAAMLEEMVDRGEALSCPTCAVVLMKKWGCDWLRCSMCKTEICWVTRGPRWGPGGKGDTSGGCRCGEKGVKCHPRCNYCH